MKKFIAIWFILGISLLMACSGDNEDSTAPSSQKEKETTSEYLHMGETTIVNDTLGKYELTINDIKYTDDINGNIPDGGGDMFVVVDTTIKVIEADEPRDSRFTGDVKLNNLTEDFLAVERNDIYPEFWAVEIPQGESADIKRVFETREADLFKEEELILITGDGLSSVTEQPVWKFTVEKYQ